jgi:hypothetical protein
MIVAYTLKVHTLGSAPLDFERFVLAAHRIALIWRFVLAIWHLFVGSNIAFIVL